MKVTSIRGKALDIAKFIEKHGDKRALGNAKMNARGDIIGQGGKVVKTSEQMIMEYNRSNPKAVSKQVALKSIQNEIYNKAVDPAQAVKQAQADAAAAAKHAQAEAKAQAEHKKPRKLVDSPETDGADGA